MWSVQNYQDNNGRCFWSLDQSLIQVHKQVSTVSRARKMQFRTRSRTDASPRVRAGPVVLRGLEAARHGESRVVKSPGPGMTASIETRTTRRTRPDDPEPDGTARIPGELLLFGFFLRFLSAVVIVCGGGKNVSAAQLEAEKKVARDEGQYCTGCNAYNFISISVLKLHYNNWLIEYKNTSHQFIKYSLDTEERGRSFFFPSRNK